MGKARKESEFTGKVAFVTGGAKGIGEAAARTLAREGAAVAIIDVDRSAGESVAKSIGDKALFVRCDVSKEAEVSKAVARVKKTLGPIDILVNSAGIQRYSKVTETTEDEWDLVMNVNLKSAFLCAKHCIPQMLGKGGGVVINLSSVQAFVSQQNVAPYTTSKTAMLGLTRSIAVDYQPHVRCIAVCPGTVDTPMFKEAIKLSPDPEAVREECNAMHVTQRIGTPEEIGEWIAFLCSSKAAFMTGQYVRVDGGLGITILGSKREK